MIGRRAERLGFSRKIASRLYAWMIVCGFLGARIGVLATFRRKIEGANRLG